jgi:hypothetical protein
MFEDGNLILSRLIGNANLDERIDEPEGGLIRD